jgi:hypothetical protein
MKLLITVVTFLIIIFFYSCQNHSSHDKKTVIENSLLELMFDNDSAIDTLTFDDFDTINHGIVQSEIMTSDQLSLKIEKHIIEDEVVDLNIFIKNTSFDISQFNGFFNKESLLYDIDISSEYYRIKVGSKTYFAFIANEKLCSGTLCKFCNLLLFQMDNAANEFCNLLPIDFFYSELHTLIPLIGTYQGELYYYKISQIDETDRFIIEPFRIKDDPNGGIEISNPEQYYLKVQLHNTGRIEILESNWL